MVKTWSLRVSEVCCRVGEAARRQCQLRYIASYLPVFSYSLLCIVVCQHLASPQPVLSLLLFVRNYISGSTSLGLRWLCVSIVDLVATPSLLTQESKMIEKEEWGACFMLYMSNSSSSIPSCTLPSYIRILPWAVLSYFKQQGGQHLGRYWRYRAAAGARDCQSGLAKAAAEWVFFENTLDSGYS